MPDNVPMSRTLFISDLHLSAERPETTRAFRALLENQGAQCDALYILGDLFDYWLGDDMLDADPHAREVADALAAFARDCAPVTLLPGNRDFLLGERFASEVGVRLVTQEAVRIDVHAQPVLLAHGDALCTDDLAYQQFRRQVRDAEWRAQFLAAPLALRTQQAQEARRQSGEHKYQSAADIMDVNREAVAELLREQNFPPLFIHGHTHRPAHHTHHIEGHICHRWVLAAWDDARAHAIVLEDGEVRSI